MDDPRGAHGAAGPSESRALRPAGSRDLRDPPGARGAVRRVVQGRMADLRRRRQHLRGPPLLLGLGAPRRRPSGRARGGARGPASIRDGVHRLCPERRRDRFGRATRRDRATGDHPGLSPDHRHRGRRGRGQARSGGNRPADDPHLLRSVPRRVHLPHGGRFDRPVGRARRARAVRRGDRLRALPQYVPSTLPSGSRALRRRDVPRLPRGARARAPGGPGADRGHPDRAGARRGRHHRAVGRVLAAPADDVRPLGLEADPRRGPDLHGPVRDDVRGRALRHPPRHPAARQGALRRRATDRRGDGHRGDHGGDRPAPGRHLLVDPGGGRRGARGDRRDPRERGDGQRAGARVDRARGARSARRADRAGGRRARLRRARRRRVRPGHGFDRPRAQLPPGGARRGGPPGGCSGSPREASGSTGYSPRSTCRRICSGGRAGG